MADDDQSPSPRPIRVPPRPSHSELLQTIAQLRDQRLANASFSSKPESHSYDRDQAVSINHRPADLQFVDLSSPAKPSSSSSGRRRLRKVGSQGGKTEASTDILKEELEDWQDTETDGNVDALADSLDSLTIGKQTKVNVSGSEKPSSNRPKILDSYVALRQEESHSLSRTTAKHDKNAKTCHDIVCLDDSDSWDKGASSHPSPPSVTKDALSSEDDDDIRVMPESKATVSRTVKNLSGKEVLGKKALVGYVPEVWDLEDEKENSGVESVTFTDGKSVYKLSEKIAKILFPHQHEGIKWLWGLHAKGMGGILGDDMGLGKTMQIAAFLAGLFASGLIKCAMIVAPKTLVAHWSKELSFVGLARKTKDYSGCAGSGREYALQHVLQVGGVLLTTYDVVRNNWKALRGDFNGRDGYGDTSDDIVTWDYIILDEGHLIKNPSTQRAKSLREIPSAHRIVLSGTPIQNNLREMWALFDFCCPQLLGDKKEFKARYEDVILRANNKDATDRQKRVGSAVAQELRKRIAPFFMRRLKSEVFPDSSNLADRKLSRKNDIIVWLRLTDRQRQLYTAFLESETAHQSLDGSALAALTVLKKICDHPALLTKRATEDIAEGMESILGNADAAVAEAMTASIAGLVDADESYKGVQGAVSCKITFIMTLLEKLVDEGHRTLIFAQTRKMLNIIQEEIISRRYCFRRIDGTMKASDREKYVQEFQTDCGIPVFLLTSQVGGLGLTLTGANRVIIVDPAWNPSTDNQSVDRAYRIGQKSDVLVYRLMTSGTIEEKIYRKQVFKGGLFRTATEQKEQFRYFSEQELRELLTLPKTGFDISLTQQQLHEEHASQYEKDENLREHIKFLESQNIAGVSHHDLLFSKQAPELPPASENELSIQWDSRKMDYGGVVSHSQSSHPTHDSARVKHEQKKLVCENQDDKEKRERLQIWATISRLSQTLADKNTVSKLPDNGENIKRKIRDLTNQLKNTEYSNATGKLTTQSIPCTNEPSMRAMPIPNRRDSEQTTVVISDKDACGLSQMTRSNLYDGQEPDQLKKVHSSADVDEMSLVLGKLNIATGR